MITDKNIDHGKAFDWGHGETRHLTSIPNIYNQYFEIETEEISDINVPFTRDSWNGRMKSCRAIGASLSTEEIERFDNEHRELLNQTVPPKFEVLHYSAITVMKKK